MTSRINASQTDITHAEKLVTIGNSKAAYTYLRQFNVDPQTSKWMAIASLSIPTIKTGTRYRLYSVAIKLNPHDGALHQQRYNLLPNTSEYVLARYIAFQEAKNANMSMNVSELDILRDLARECVFDASSRLVPVSKLVEVIRLLRSLVIIKYNNKPELPQPMVAALYTAKELVRFTLSRAKCFRDFRPIMNMKWLRELTLNSIDNMSELPVGLCGLSELVSLSITDQYDLTCLPDQIWQLTNLQYLNVKSCNRLTTLPPSVAQLSQLRSLNLIWCEALESLPLAIGNMDLRCLDISHCHQLFLHPLFRVLRWGSNVQSVQKVMQQWYHPSKLLMLILIARRRRIRHLPDELWLQLILNDHLSDNSIS